MAFSREELNIKEKCWINIYDSFNDGYNNTLGGEGRSCNNYPTGKNNINSKKVYQISPYTGEILKKWDCISDVNRELNIDSSKICNVCRGTRKTSQGFVWCYVEQYDENKDHRVKPKSKNRTKGLKPILLLDDSNNIIKEFKSVNEASRNLNISTFEMSNICSKKTKNKYGINIVYKNDFIIGNND